ncbi:MAG: hypothetical protein KBT68_04555 [bacterium]|nr:hypothetical protein [Candidatus Colisoma equi]
MPQAAQGKREEEKGKVVGGPILLGKIDFSTARRKREAKKNFGSLLPTLSA